MNTKVEQLEKSMVKLTIEVGADVFEQGMQAAYLKNKGKIAVQGFRKGKVPRKLIEKAYGADIFYEDAANHVIPTAYDAAVEENKLEVISRPEIDIEQIEAGKAFIFTAEVAVKPEVTLGEYKSVKISKQEIEITDEDIDEEINKTREQNSRIIDVTDRAIVDGDEVVIDFEGFIDGEVFEGGTAENHTLKIGSKAFIGDFEEQLIGKSIDDELEVNVSFPTDYHQEDLQGKPAMFKVKINAIKTKELPEVDDEFAMDVSEFDTLDEYKADIKATIKERKENEAKRAKQEEVMKVVIENSTMEIADSAIELEAENMVHDFAHRIQQQGIGLEQYFSITGQNVNTLKENMKVEAENKMKAGFVLSAIAKAENIEVSEEEYNKNLEEMASMYNMDMEKISETIGEEEKESITQDLLNQKALDLVVEAAIEE